MAWPRSRSSRAVSASVSAPAAASAEYSPSEWPATKARPLDRRRRTRVSSARTTARLTAISAGWAFSVRVSVSIGPSRISLESFSPSASSTSSNTSRGGGEGLGQLGAHADGLAALAGKDEGEAHA